MTTEFRDPGFEFREELHESIDADGLRVRKAFCSLPVKRPTVMNFGIGVPQRDTELPADFDQYRTRGIFIVHMLVRVHVRWLVARQAMKRGKLTGNLGCHGGRVLRLHDVIQGHPHFAVEGPLTKIDVETQAEFWMASGVICGFGGGRPTHHQAGAGHDAVLMGFDDAAVHAAALAEIISVHDEKLGRHLVPHKARAPCKGAGSLAGGERTRTPGNIAVNECAPAGARGAPATPAGVRIVVVFVAWPSRP